MFKNNLYIVKSLSLKFELKMFKHFFKFQTPAPIIVAGPTQCGKTEFVIKLLKNKQLFTETPNRIIWAYGQKNDKQIQKIYEVDPSIEFVDGLPNIDDIHASDTNLLILDDLMDEVLKNKSMSQLFTRGCHHKNITVIAIIHNIYAQEKYARTISLNTHYKVLFNSIRDRTQIKHFGGQMFPDNPKFVYDAYKEVTCEPYGYLVLDIKPNSKETLRVVGGIFPDELPVLYTP